MMTGKEKDTKLQEYENALQIERELIDAFDPVLSGETAMRSSTTAVMTALAMFQQVVVEAVAGASRQPADEFFEQYIDTLRTAWQNRKRRKGSKETSK